MKKKYKIIFWSICIAVIIVFGVIFLDDCDGKCRGPIDLVTTQSCNDFELGINHEPFLHLDTHVVGKKIHNKEAETGCDVWFAGSPIEGLNFIEKEFGVEL